MTTGRGDRLADIAAFGITGGLAIAWAAGRLLIAFLYQVSSGSVVEFIVGVALITIVTGLATLVPARRAARTDPASIMRGD